MKAEAFFQYLTTRYRSRKTGEPLAPRAARDAVSRCQRIESVLKIDFDATLRQADAFALLMRLETHERAFKFSGNSRHGLSQHRAAAKLYAAFVSGARQTEKTRHFYPGRYP